MDSTFIRILNKQSFDLVVIEEAGKCYPSELFHVLTLGQKILLIGDQNQLPPFEIKETEEAVRIWEKFLNKAKLKCLWRYLIECQRKEKLIIHH